MEEIEYENQKEEIKTMFFKIFVYRVMCGYVVWLWEGNGESAL